MPRLRLPESDQDRRQVLEKSLETAPLDVAANDGAGYLPAALVTSLTAFFRPRPPATPGGPPLPGFDQKVKTLIAARAATSTEIGQADRADATLETFMRDYLDGLKRRTFREGHPAAVLNFFDLPQDGNLPAFSSRADRHGWAQKLLDGETAAVAAGYPAMSNPTAAEVAAKLTVARREAAEITPKSREEEAALAAVREARTRANELIGDIVAELRHNTRRLPDGTARDVMRSYGLTFEFLPGEPADAAGGTTATTPPTAPVVQPAHAEATPAAAEEGAG